MRGREFLMKDAYSFDLDAEEGAKAAYNRMFVAYLRTFERCGLKSIPMRADTGPIGGDLSHEFIILAETGESQVFCHRDLSTDRPASRHDLRRCDLAAIVEKWTSLYAATDEHHDPGSWAPKALPNARFPHAASRSATSSISAPSIPSRWAASAGSRRQACIHVQMGSYGIGPSRLAAAIIEASHDENGIIWPRASRPSRSG
jgi:prolyl-tRNA synthetase